MHFRNKKWFILIVLSLIWGSSFILIKKGLIGLTPMQLGALRIVFSAIFIFIFGFHTLKSPDNSIYEDNIKAKDACPVKIISVKLT